LSLRQTKRLIQRYRRQGAPGLASNRRGKPSNHAIADAVREDAISLVKKRYSDFGPTFAHEKLCEQHAMTFSVETLRKWMIEADIWEGKKRPQARIHPSRPRRSQRGELVQIDGSPHDWFEGRGAKCTLIVFIDDATSELLALRFFPAETTQAYMETLSEVLDEYGRPVSLYSDKHGIFRVNRTDQEANLTQFSRAAKTLDITIIHANTPQAKGRVERANQTLQDRLVKEMRLRGIDDIDSANRFLPDFRRDYNQRFAVPPSSAEVAYRPVLHSKEELGLIFSVHHTRKLSKNLTLQYKNKQYQVQGEGQGYRLRQANVTVCEAFDGAVALLYKNRVLAYKIVAVGEKAIPLADEKTINHQVDQAIRRQSSNVVWKPAPDHPWRRGLTGRGKGLAAPLGRKAPHSPAGI
jgi:hypothetical protein